MGRTAVKSRKTRETEVSISIDLDGAGKSAVSTGVGFFDHMMELFSRHGLFDLTVEVRGDLNVDSHHTVEDTGIVLGQAIREALGDKLGVKRYGSSFVPMDESLAFCALDLSSRPCLVFEGSLPAERVGEFETGLVEEFFRAVAVNAAVTLHLKIMYGTNAHHMIEALFKAFARALSDASRIDERIKGVMSTKEVL